MIILLTGQKNSGKDSIAACLARLNNGQVVSLATPLKNFTMDILGLPPINVFGPSQKRETPLLVDWKKFQYLYQYRNLINQYFSDWQIPESKWDTIAQRLKMLLETLERQGANTARILLQQIGTEWARAVDPYLWANIAIRTANQKLMDGYHLVIIPDGRFPNEILTVKQAGGKIVKVTCPQVAHSADPHVSENTLKEYPDWWYDALFENNKDLGLEVLENLTNQLFDQLISLPLDIGPITPLEPEITKALAESQLQGIELADPGGYDGFSKEILDEANVAKTPMIGLEKTVNLPAGSWGKVEEIMIYDTAKSYPNAAIARITIPPVPDEVDEGD